MSEIPVTNSVSIVDGVPMIRGVPFDPMKKWPHKWRKLKIVRGLDGSVIEPFRITYSVTVRRITHQGKTWWEPENDAKFIGPQEARKLIKALDRERLFEETP